MTFNFACAFSLKCFKTFFKKNYANIVIEDTNQSSQKRVSRELKRATGMLESMVVKGEVYCSY